MKLSNVFEKIKFTQVFCETMIDSTRKKKRHFHYPVLLQNFYLSP